MSGAAAGSVQIAREGASAAWRLEPGALEVAWSPEPHADPDPAATERAWRTLTSRFPQMFDGPISAADRFAPGSPVVRARPSSYKPYAAGVESGASSSPDDPTHSRRPTLFAVTGVVISRDESGVERILLARRGGATWLYVGMWELAPAGGLPPPGAEALDGARWRTDALANHLLTELEEETGASLAAGAGLDRPFAPTPIALVHDALVRSLDVVLRLDVGPEFAERIASHAAPGNPGAPAPGTSGAVHEHGEYSRLDWTPLADLPRFIADRPGQVIPPTIAVLRALGLLG